MLAGKNIVVGISGGIAAYIIPELVRRLRDQGATVRVVMTAGAKAFITPLTLQAVSGYPVSDDLLDPAAEAAMGHIELAKWADTILIAPASANTIARLAHGFADDLLSTICLATAAPIMVAPAMNQQMWAAPAVTANMALLAERGIHIAGPGSGEQACGDVGAGRMLEPLELVSAIADMTHSTNPEPLFAKQRIVITAGPTQEAIDPVRYLTNKSSGKMGFALATAAQQLGAEVILIAGPCHLPTPMGVTRVDVVTAEQMLAATLEYVGEAELFIGCAAVADYRPARLAEQKIKKDSENMTVELIRNPDILATVAGLPKPPATLGFAAETQDVETYARGKLERKKLSMIAANNVSQTGIGFNSDDNALTLYWLADGQPQQQQFEKADKLTLAQRLLAKVHQHITHS